MFWHHRALSAGELLDFFTCLWVTGEKAAGIVLVDGQFLQLASIFYPIPLQNSFSTSGVWGFAFHGWVKIFYAKVACYFCRSYIPTLYLFFFFRYRTVLKWNFNRENLMWFLFLTRINLIRALLGNNECTLRLSKKENPATFLSSPLNFLRLLKFYLNSIN